ncbi:MAG: hypothetical protein ACO1N9_05540 [Flavobacterium sp.]
MSNIPIILKLEFQALKADIIARYEASGMKASGNWAQTVAVEMSGTSASITAADYIKGRPPGKQPPSEAILKWLEDKGIASSIQKDISLSSLAYLIARKIARKGWQPKQGHEDIINTVATPERIQSIINKVGESELAGFTANLLQYLQASAQV